MKHYVCAVCDNGFAVEPLYTRDRVEFCPFCGAVNPNIHDGLVSARGAAVRRGDLDWRAADEREA